jgi:hypothetical protein
MQWAQTASSVEAMTGSHAQTRTARPFVRLALLAAVPLALAGYEFATDTPLGVTADHRAVAPGVQITGKVIYPDGKMTVTIAPAASPATDGHRTRGEEACDYRHVQHRFSCETDALPVGLYVVQVTDAAQPGEGTALAQVAVTDTPGYDPQITVADGTGEAKAGRVTLVLTGWKPGSPVLVRLVYQNGKTVFTGRALPDAQGQARLRTPALLAGHDDIVATDGLWKIGGAEGLLNGVSPGIQVS